MYVLQVHILCMCILNVNFLSYCYLTFTDIEQTLKVDIIRSSAINSLR